MHKIFDLSTGELREEDVSNTFESERKEERKLYKKKQKGKAKRIEKKVDILVKQLGALVDKDNLKVSAEMADLLKEVKSKDSGDA